MKYNEISHFSHPQHKLKFEYSESPFKCDGCKEVGIGSSYKCTVCDFDLHVHCAIPSPSISHPFYTRCSFQFMSHPPGNISRYCNACEKDVTGFIYHCKTCGFDLHPCCAKLPMALSDGEIKLYLYKKVSSSCHRCGRKGRSWCYRSSCKKYNLHVACVKEMLEESWHELYFGRGKSTKLQTRIPSLKNTLQTHHNKGKGKMKSCCEMAGMAVQTVISAVLGDPTALIAGVIGAQLLSLSTSEIHVEQSVGPEWASLPLSLFLVDKMSVMAQLLHSNGIYLEQQGNFKREKDHTSYSVHFPPFLYGLIMAPSFTCPADLLSVFLVYKYME